MNKWRGQDCSNQLLFLINWSDGGKAMEVGAGWLDLFTGAAASTVVVPPNDLLILRREQAAAGAARS